MNNFMILIKNSLLRLIGFYQGKKNRKSTISATLILLAGMVGIFVLYFYQAKSMYNGLLAKICVFHAYMICLTVLIVMGVMRTAGTKKKNDDDLLLSLPIKKRDIILSKTISKYVFDLYFTIVLIVPYLSIYVMEYEFSPFILINFILTVFLLPLFSVGITYICDFVITKLFNKSKYANLLKSMVSVFIFILTMGLMLIKTFGYGNVNLSSLVEYFSDRPISYEFLKFVLENNWISFIYILLLTVGVFIVGILLYMKNFGKNFVGYHSKNRNLVFRDSKSVFGSLFKKEVANYIQTPIFITNTIIGPIILIAFSIIMCATGIDKIALLFGTEIDPKILVGVILLIMLFSCAMTSISSSTISLEGKNFWLLKSSPVNENAVLLSKALLNIVMLVPAVVISSVIILIFMKLSIIDFLMILLIPTVFSLIVSFGGLFINLLYPKMKWEDESQVVKQGMAVLISMIFGIVCVLIPVLLYVLFSSIGIYYLSLITFGIYLIILAVTVILLFTVGKKLYCKIQI